MLMRPFLWFSNTVLSVFILINCTLNFMRHIFILMYFTLFSMHFTHILIHFTLFSFREQLWGQYNRGLGPRICAPVVRRRNQAVFDMVLDFENPQRERLDYLRGIAHNFNLAWFFNIFSLSLCVLFSNKKDRNIRLNSLKAQVFLQSLYDLNFRAKITSNFLPISLKIVFLLATFVEFIK